ncbi:cellulose binding domain-containing protein, partial [Cellvibrio sp.]
MNACKSSAHQRLQHLKRPLVFLGMATALAAAAQTASAACTYQIDNEWSNGFVASIQIKNETAASV